jgi:sirohydrochlorin ferrochelatase
MAMADALILIGHGSRSKHADDVLPYYVKALRGGFDEAIACYLEQEPGIKEALKLVKSERVFVMPLLLANGHHTMVTIPEALGIRDGHGYVDGKEIIYLEPLGRSCHIVELIKERIRESGKK